MPYTLEESRDIIDRTDGFGSRGKALHPNLLDLLDSAVPAFQDLIHTACRRRWLPKEFIIDPFGMYLDALHRGCSFEHIQAAWSGLTRRLSIAEERFKHLCFPETAHKPTPASDTSQIEAQHGLTSSSKTTTSRCDVTSQPLPLLSPSSTNGFPQAVKVSSNHSKALRTSDGNMKGREKLRHGVEGTKRSELHGIGSVAEGDFVRSTFSVAASLLRKTASPNQTSHSTRLDTMPNGTGALKSPPPGLSSTPVAPSFVVINTSSQAELGAPPSCGGAEFGLPGRIPMPSSTHSLVQHGTPLTSESSVDSNPPGLSADSFSWTKTGLHISIRPSTPIDFTQDVTGTVKSLSAPVSPPGIARAAIAVSLASAGVFAREESPSTPPLLFAACEDGITELLACPLHPGLFPTHVTGSTTLQAEDTSASDNVPLDPGKDPPLQPSPSTYTSDTPGTVKLASPLVLPLELPSTPLDSTCNTPNADEMSVPFVSSLEFPFTTITKSFTVFDTARPAELIPTPPLVVAGSDTAAVDVQGAVHGSLVPIHLPALCHRTRDPPDHDKAAQSTPPHDRFVFPTIDRSFAASWPQAHLDSFPTRTTAVLLFGTSITVANAALPWRSWEADVKRYAHGVPEWFARPRPASVTFSPSSPPPSCGTYVEHFPCQLTRSPTSIPPSSVGAPPSSISINRSFKDFRTSSEGELGAAPHSSPTNRDRMDIGLPSEVYAPSSARLLSMHDNSSVSVSTNTSSPLADDSPLTETATPVPRRLLARLSSGEFIPPPSFLSPDVCPSAPIARSCVDPNTFGGAYCGANSHLASASRDGTKITWPGDDRSPSSTRLPSGLNAPTSSGSSALSNPSICSPEESSFTETASPVSPHAFTPLDSTRNAPNAVDVLPHFRSPPGHPSTPIARSLAVPYTSNGAEFSTTPSFASPFYDVVEIGLPSGINTPSSTCSPSGHDTPSTSGPLALIKSSSASVEILEMVPSTPAIREKHGDAFSDDLSPASTLSPAGFTFPMIARSFVDSRRPAPADSPTAPNVAVSPHHDAAIGRHIMYVYEARRLSPSSTHMEDRDISDTNDENLVLLVPPTCQAPVLHPTPPVQRRPSACLKYTQLIPDAVKLSPGLSAMPIARISMEAAPADSTARDVPAPQYDGAEITEVRCETTIKQSREHSLSPPPTRAPPPTSPMAPSPPAAGRECRRTLSDNVSLPELILPTIFRSFVDSSPSTPVKTTPDITGPFVLSPGRPSTPINRSFVDFNTSGEGEFFSIPQLATTSRDGTAIGLPGGVCTPSSTCSLSNHDTPSIPALQGHSIRLDSAQHMPVDRKMSLDLSRAPITPNTSGQAEFPPTPPRPVVVYNPAAVHVHSAVPGSLVPVHRPALPSRAQDPPVRDKSATSSPSYHGFVSSTIAPWLAVSGTQSYLDSFLATTTAVPYHGAAITVATAALPRRSWGADVKHDAHGVPERFVRPRPRSTFLISVVMPPLPPPSSTVQPLPDSLSSDSTPIARSFAVFNAHSEALRIPNEKAVGRDKRNQGGREMKRKSLQEIRPLPEGDIVCCTFSTEHSSPMEPTPLIRPSVSAHLDPARDITGTIKSPPPTLFRLTISSSLISGSLACPTPSISSGFVSMPAVPSRPLSHLDTARSVADKGKTSPESPSIPINRSLVVSNPLSDADLPQTPPCGAARCDTAVIVQTHATVPAVLVGLIHIEFISAPTSPKFTLSPPLASPPPSTPLDPSQYPGTSHSTVLVPMPLCVPVDSDLPPIARSSVILNSSISLPPPSTPSALLAETIFCDRQKMEVKGVVATASILTPVSQSLVGTSRMIHGGWTVHDTPPSIPLKLPRRPDAPDEDKSTTPTMLCSGFSCPTIAQPFAISSTRIYPDSFPPREAAAVHCDGSPIRIIKHDVEEMGVRQETTIDQSQEQSLSSLPARDQCSTPASPMALSTPATREECRRALLQTLEQSISLLNEGDSPPISRSLEYRVPFYLLGLHVEGDAACSAGDSEEPIMGRKGILEMNDDNLTLAHSRPPVDTIRTRCSPFLLIPVLMPSPHATQEEYGDALPDNLSWPPMLSPAGFTFLMITRSFMVSPFQQELRLSLAMV